MTGKSHPYRAHIVWTGNRGSGTERYADYGREHRIEIADKATLTGSADPVFRGDGTLHNPEDLFLSAISACHMLTYLALCARRGVVVSAYEDHAEGVLTMDSTGGGRFESVTLHPAVTLLRAEDLDLTMQLHEAAHGLCFIGASCSTPIHCVPSAGIA